MPTLPIDPLDGPKIVLVGRIVCMDKGFTVIKRGVIYVENGNIVAVQDAKAPLPTGFENIKPVNTLGTIYPGLIELHNHLAYNILRLWNVPKKYGNRDQWSGTPEYRRLVSGPMTVMGKTPGLLPALVRYVECKCLLGGVTTSQGIQLFSNAGVRRFYRGIVRNVEQTDEADLPEAVTRVDDIEASYAGLFLERLKKQSCFLLHLSEGVDIKAREHFLALQLASGGWAVTDALTGIHCTGLKPADFAVLGSHGGSMVWSPLSNLLLYGGTADVAAARSAGVRIGIGSDWSPSGSKNLLGELKVAKICAGQGAAFPDRDLVAMATSSAASILKWDKVLGSIEPGKRADFVIISGTVGDPYSKLIGAKEKDIRLVMINGVARYGSTTLMSRLGVTGENIRVGGTTRAVFLSQNTQDPAVSLVSLTYAKEILSDALARLPELAKELEKPRLTPRSMLGEPVPVSWELALDEIYDTGLDLRPRLPLRGGITITGPTRALARASQPLSTFLSPLTLDPLTSVDDHDLLSRLVGQINLPSEIKEQLRSLW
ncbi:MAG: amidohydrolase family protein [Geobacter sp.]|nr:amidohydrolase family protein [Geobacter sp.]